VSPQTSNAAQHHAQRSPAARETGATIKLILSVMEELAGLPPAEACEPYYFEQQRARVLRRLHAMAEVCRREGAP
jgi:hypothetical protein